jgi:hypothetical protein
MERFYRRKRSKTKKQPEHLTPAFKESKCTDVLTDTFFTFFCKIMDGKMMITIPGLAVFSLELCAVTGV